MSLYDWCLRFFFIFTMPRENSYFLSFSIFVPWPVFYNPKHNNEIISKHSIYFKILFLNDIIPMINALIWSSVYGCMYILCACRTVKKPSTVTSSPYCKTPNFLLQASLPYSKYSFLVTKLFCSSLFELNETKLLPPCQANVSGLLILLIKPISLLSQLTLKALQF